MIYIRIIYFIDLHNCYIYWFDSIDFIVLFVWTNIPAADCSKASL